MVDPVDTAARYAISRLVYWTFGLASSVLLLLKRGQTREEYSKEQSCGGGCRKASTPEKKRSELPLKVHLIFYGTPAPQGTLDSYTQSQHAEASRIVLSGLWVIDCGQSLQPNIEDHGKTAHVPGVFSLPAKYTAARCLKSNGEKSVWMRVMPAE